MPLSVLTDLEQALGDLLLIQHKAIVKAVPVASVEQLILEMNGSNFRDFVKGVYASLPAEVAQGSKDNDVYVPVEVTPGSSSRGDKNWQGHISAILEAVAQTGVLYKLIKLPGLKSQFLAWMREHDVPSECLVQDFKAAPVMYLGFPPSKTWDQDDVPNIILRARFDTEVWIDWDKARSTTRCSGRTDMVHRPCFVEIRAKTGWSAMYLPTAAVTDLYDLILPGCDSSIEDVHPSIVTEWWDSMSEASTTVFSASLTSIPAASTTV